MTFKIDSNIPVPSAGGRSPRIDYPFLEMKVGQSIFVPDMNVKKMSGQVGHWKKNHGMNFTIRAMTEDVMDEESGELVATEGVRVWVKDPEDRSNRGRKKATAAAPAETTTGTEGDGTVPGTEPADETQTIAEAEAAAKSAKSAKATGKKSSKAKPGDDSDY